MGQPGTSQPGIGPHSQLQMGMPQIRGMNPPPPGMQTGQQMPGQQQQQPGGGGLRPFF